MFSYFKKNNKYYFIFQIITALVMYYLFSQLIIKMDISQLNLSEKKIELIEIIVLAFIMFFIRSIRLYLLFNKKISLLNSVLITVKTYTLNNILPFRMGEFYRIVASKKLLDISYKKAFFFIVAERLIDVFFLILITSVGSYVFYFSTLSLLYSLILILFLCLFSIFCIFLINKIFQLYIKKKYNNFYKILTSFYLLIPKLLFVSIFIYIVEIFIYHQTSKIVGVEIPLLYLLYLIGTSNLIPILFPTPGGLGSFEYVVIGILTYNLSYGEVISINYAIFTHFVLIIPISILGITIFSLSFIRKIFRIVVYKK